MRALLSVSLFALVGPLLPAQGPAGAKVDFLTEVVPIFKARCFECHGPKEQEGGLRLDTKAGLFVADEKARTVRPGQAAKSPLVQRIELPKDDPDVMPAEGGPLTKAQIAVIRRWIDQGAVWPDGADKAIAALIAGSAAGKAKPSESALPTLPMPAGAQKEAEQRAFAAIRKAGGVALRVAADTGACEVNLSLVGDKLTPEVLGQLEALAATLVRLDLSRTKAGDDALQVVGKLGQLRWLNLARTAVTDRGLSAVANLKHLGYLNLYGTGVTDVGLQQVRGLAALRKLYVWGSKVTESGAAALRKACPKLRVDRGESAVALASVVVAPKTGPINTQCAVSPTKSVAAGKEVVYEGQRIGFCCDKCKAAFLHNPGKFLPGLRGFLHAKGSVAANKSCPVSGKPVAGSATEAPFRSPFRGKVIGFCCAKCKAAFDKEPERFLPKLTDVFGAPASPAKPGKPVKPGKTKKVL